MNWVPDLPEGRDHRSKSPNIFSPPPPEGAGGDYEQEQARPIWQSSGAGYAELYVLAALEPTRHQLQVLHEFDSCCFRAAGLESGIRDYNLKFVRPQLAASPGGGGWFQTVVTAGNFHQVNVRDKVLVAVLVERLRLNGKLTPSDFTQLPFDDLKL